MNKKLVVIFTIILVLVVVGTLIFMKAVPKNNENYEKLSSEYDFYLQINDVKYDAKDFENYLKVRQYEADETPVVIDDEFSTYKVYKLFIQYAKSKNIELPTENAVPELAEEEYTKLHTDYNLSKEDYINTKREIALVDYVYENLQDFYDISDEEYNSYISASSAFNHEKMYYYRVMRVDFETKDNTSVNLQNDEQARKSAAMTRATEALNKVKSGVDFEAVANEYGNDRLIYLPDGSFNIVNGKQETVSDYYMESYINDSGIINALRTLKPGEYSEIFESSDETSYCFVYLEDVKEGIESVDKNELIKEIALENIKNNAVIIDNSKNNLFKTYKYRILMVNNEDTSKEKIDKAYEEIKNGGNFEEIALKYGDGNYTYDSNSGNYRRKINGELETMSGIKLMNDSIISEIYYYINGIDTDNIMSLKKGELSEIYESNYIYDIDYTGTKYYFIYMEDVIDGISEEDNDFYKSLFNK